MAKNGCPQVGDIAQINRDEAAITLSPRAEIIHTPAGEGDMWGFKDVSTGCLWWTNERMTIFLLERKESANG